MVDTLTRLTNVEGLGLPPYWTYSAIRYEGRVWSGKWHNDVLDLIIYDLDVGMSREELVDSIPAMDWGYVDSRGEWSGLD